MTSGEPNFTIGVEEEYLLVDLESRDLVHEPPSALFDALEAALGAQVMPEFLRAQIEVGTKVCHSVAEIRDDLIRLRATVVRIARDFGCAPIAASTHPFASWHMQKHTDKDRYNVLAEDM
ncbi:MAG: glutamate-cysteine ligase family protein, partial [Alphaproteobacteria bacterium]